jgi:hypothetical protein
MIAVVFFYAPIEPGVHFYCENESSLQVGKQWRAKGEKIRPHRHLPVTVERKETLKEVLYIEKGKVKIIFYTDGWKEIGSRTLNAGDMVMLISGGHGFEMLEETEMIEIKQGPYNPGATKRMEDDKP